MDLTLNRTWLVKTVLADGQLSRLLGSALCSINQDAFMGDFVVWEL